MIFTLKSVTNVYVVVIHWIIICLVIIRGIINHQLLQLFYPQVPSVLIFKILASIIRDSITNTEVQTIGT